MRYADRSFVILALLVSASAAGACGNEVEPSEVRVLTTETFSGTIAPLGASFHAFTVNYTVSFTDASMTLTNLTVASSGAVPPITIGLAFGNLNQGVCTRAPSYTRVATSVNQELPTADAPFQAGVYCVQIFDNLDKPTVPEPLNYTLSVKHF